MAEITIVHPRVLQETDLKAMAALRTSAREVVYKMCSGERKFYMSIPVQDDDPDIVLLNAIDSAERLAQEVYRIRGEIKTLLAEQHDMPDECRSKLMAIIFDGGN